MARRPPAELYTRPDVIKHKRRKPRAPRDFAREILVGSGPGSQCSWVQWVLIEFPEKHKLVFSLRLLTDAHGERENEVIRWAKVQIIPFRPAGTVFEVVAYRPTARKIKKKS